MVRARCLIQTCGCRNAPDRESRGCAATREPPTPSRYGSSVPLRYEREVLESVASAQTAWQALDEVTPAAAKRIDKARARVRAHVWSQLPRGVLASHCDRHPVCP